MKYLFIRNGAVGEIIPEENPVFPGVPVTERYSTEFLANCVEVADDTEVVVGYIKTDTGFEPPPAVDPDDGAELEVTDDGTPEPTLRERVTQLESDNTTLSAQLKASTESNAFLEECIVEMAGVIYA